MLHGVLENHCATNKYSRSFLIMVDAGLLLCIVGLIIILFLVFLQREFDECRGHEIKLRKMDIEREKERTAVRAQFSASAI